MNSRHLRLSKISWHEKCAYAVGDLGFNLYWASIASFLAVFYTDVFGIPAAAAGTMFLVTKIVDAITDPLMGAIADRTHSRWGKFRPYLIFAAAPLAGAGVLTFSTPDLNETGKLIYAYASFSLLMLCYTILSTPYSSLSGVITAEPQQRNQLVSFRFIAAFAGTALVNKFTLPLVEHFSSNENGVIDTTVGWQYTMVLYGAVASICFAMVFLFTKERVVSTVTRQSSPIQDIKDLTANGPWLILVALALVIMVTISLRSGSAYYYLKYYFERPDLISNYLLLQGLALAAGAAITPILTRFFDKKGLLIALMSIVAVLSLVQFILPAENITAIFILNGAISLALGPKSPLAWSMYADAADFTEWRTKRRATAMTFSAATFAQKLGGALASALMLWILAAAGYVANAAQVGASLHSIALLQTVIPAVFALLAVIVISFYPLNNTVMERIQRTLVFRNERITPVHPTGNV